MNVHGIPTSSPRPIVAHRSHESHSHPTVDAKDDKKAVVASEEETVDASAETGAPVEQRGVIRLLMEGHFHGVANVRLRINFDEEIAALDASAAKETTAPKVAALVEAVTGRIDALTTSGQLSEEDAAAAREFATAFASEVETAGAEFAGGTIASEELVSRIRATFDSMAASLSELFAAELSPLFEASMADLESAIANASALPEISEPHGNGRAYAKFLAIYEGMRSSEPETPPLVA